MRPIWLSFFSVVAEIVSACQPSWFPISTDYGNICHKVIVKEYGRIRRLQDAEKLCNEENATLSEFDEKDSKFLFDITDSRVNPFLRSNHDDSFWISPLSLIAASTDATECFSYHRRKTKKFEKILCYYDSGVEEQYPMGVICQRDSDQTKTKEPSILRQSYPNLREDNDNYSYTLEKQCYWMLPIAAISLEIAQLMCSLNGGKFASLNSHDEFNNVADMIIRGISTERAPKDLRYVWMNFEKAEIKAISEEDPNTYSSLISERLCTLFSPIEYLHNTTTAFQAISCESNRRIQQAYILCQKEVRTEKVPTILYICVIMIASCMLVSVIVSLVLIASRYRKSSPNPDVMLSLFHKYLDLNIDEMNFDRSFQIHPDYLTEIEKIGEGFCGSVCKAILRHPVHPHQHLKVAVKSVKEYADTLQRTMLDKEIKLVCQMENHPNVISVVGAVFSNSVIGNRLVVEYCNCGSLRDYLLNGCVEKNVGLDDLISFSYQISSGMEYLSSLPCLHRDLAARNVLIKDNAICRITDFGLANFAYYYQVEHNKQLPVRWMSPETIRTNKFSMESDVWSFGILLYEIFSFAEIPYNCININKLPEEIISGAKNRIPDNCPSEIGDLMNLCWQLNPDLRPSFKACSAIIAEYFKIYYKERQRNLNRILKHERILQDSYKKWLPSYYSSCSTTISDEAGDMGLTYCNL